MLNFLIALWSMLINVFTNIAILTVRLEIRNFVLARNPVNPYMRLRALTYIFQL